MLTNYAAAPAIALARVAVALEVTSAIPLQLHPSRECIKSLLTRDAPTTDYALIDGESPSTPTPTRRRSSSQGDDELPEAPRDVEHVAITLGFLAGALAVALSVRSLGKVLSLVGATGSGLTNLAFLEPGAMVIELASRHYEQQFFDMLVLRVHGSLLRGTISYRKSYAKAVHLTADGSIGRAIKADGSDNPGRSFNVVANVSDVARVLLEELQHRARGWWREGE